MFKNSNVTEELCPICSRNLRFKAACCSDKNTYYVCMCGYKKVKVENETDTVRDSGGSTDATGV
jgi:hypothetical protein